MTPVVVDERLHEALIRAEREDCELRQKESSAYLEYWQTYAACPSAVNARPLPALLAR